MEIVQKLISLNETLIPTISENNNRFAIRVDHHYYVTKDKNKATTIVAVNKDASTNIKIIKELKDP